MSPDRDPPRSGNDDREIDAHDDDSPRSIFSALWFRALLTLLVLGVLAAVAVPYVLDLATAPKPMATSAKSGTPSPVTAAPSTATSTAAPADPAAPAVTGESRASAPPLSSDAGTVAPEAPTAAPAKPKASPPPAAKSRAVVAKAAETPKPQAKATEAEKPAPKAAETVKPAAAKAASGGPYWVQVGAFKDPETAKRLAARLRGQGFRVEESTTTATSARAPAARAAAPRTDRYDVVVSGASVADVDAKLAPKGLKGEATANGVVVRPSMALRDAVTLSRELADAGLSVQVRRISGSAPAPAAAPTAPTTLHRVRVGGFPDRAAAVEAMKRLEDKGLKAFLARGNE
jgi:cell division protein FtsN